MVPNSVQEPGCTANPPMGLEHQEANACFTNPPFAVCMHSVCVTYAVQKQHGLIVLSHRTRLQSSPDPWLFTTNTAYIHNFDFKSKRC